ncbi:MAG: sugar ABC transporter permease [Anaerolineae bacterium]|nr:sugar ABC transporter permease [Anaerolineae bacterium]
MNVTLEKRSPVLMILPIVIILAIMFVFLFYVIGLSLTDSTLSKPFQGFVGLANFRKALADETFRKSIGNTLVFAFGVTAIETFLGFVLALALYTEIRAGRILRTLAMLPLFTPPVAVAMIWRLIYDPVSGFLNHYLLKFGLIERTIAFLGRADLAMPALMAADIWQWTPFCFLLILAALQSLPSEPYEAAAVDGASSWQVFRSITLPLVTPSLIVTFLFRLIIALKVFDLVFILTYGGPGSATQVMSFYIYKVGFTMFKTGYAAALTLLVFLMVAVISTILTTGRDLLTRWQR